MKHIPRRISNEIIRGEKALKAAQTLFEEDLYEDCVSRSYYCVLHAAKAALLNRDVETGSHEGVKRMFGLHLVKPGIIEKQYAAILTAEKEDRELGDYETGIVIKRERAEQRVNDAREFLDRVKKYLTIHN